MDTPSFVVTMILTLALVFSATLALVNSDNLDKCTASAEAAYELAVQGRDNTLEMGRIALLLSEQNLNSSLSALSSLEGVIDDAEAVEQGVEELELEGCND